MVSQLTTHLPVDSIPMGDGAADRSVQPVVLIAFAKLIMLVGASAFFMPLWLQWMGDYAYGPPPQTWGALRLVALGGSAAFLAVATIILQVWIGLLKHLARAD